MAWPVGAWGSSLVRVVAASATTHWEEGKMLAWLGWLCVLKLVLHATGC